MNNFYLLQGNKVDERQYLNMIYFPIIFSILSHAKKHRSGQYK